MEYSEPFCSTEGHTAVPQSVLLVVMVVLELGPVQMVKEGEMTLSGDVLHKSQ